MANKTKDLVVFIERNSLTFSGGLLEKTVKLSFDEKIISDLEIVDRKLFVENILTRIKNTKTPVNLILIFSDDASFFKELPITSTREQIEVEEKNFLQLMPFDKVAHKLIKFTDNYKFIGINGDTCAIISDTLFPVGYKLSMVLPGSVVTDFRQRTVFPDSLKIYNLIDTNDENQSGRTSVPIPQKKFLLPILIGVFSVLIMVLIYLIFKRT